MRDAELEDTNAGKLSLERRPPYGTLDRVEQAQCVALTSGHQKPEPTPELKVVDPSELVVGRVLPCTFPSDSRVLVFQTS